MKARIMMLFRAVPLLLVTFTLVVMVPSSMAFAPTRRTQHRIYNEDVNNNNNNNNQISNARRNHFSILSATSGVSSGSSSSIKNEDDDDGHVPNTNQNSNRDSTSKTTPSKRISFLMCPAQFCVPADYEVLWEELKVLQQVQQQQDISTTTTNSQAASESSFSFEVGTCVTAPLPRTEWIKVARQLPTRNFWDATLPVHKTLDWYFDAIEIGLSQIIATELERQPKQNIDDIRICIIGHSIGGWVARAYLGGLSRSSSAISRLAPTICSSLITLGTPHIAPSTALVDQTRGLIREIDECPSCSAQYLADQYNIVMTCVCSDNIVGKFFSTNVEEIIAASSYLPLLGNSAVQGDGIVPLDLAFMDSPAQRVILKSGATTAKNEKNSNNENDKNSDNSDRQKDFNNIIRHSHVVPIPWNLWDGYAPSISLPKEFDSYVSPAVVPQWALYIQ